MRPTFKKNNAVTDGYIPKTPKQVLPDKLLNVLLYLYEKNGPHFSVSIYKLVNLLGLSANGVNYTRIREAIKILQSPIELRDFTYKGERIKWLQSVFISAVFQKEGEEEKIHFKIEDMFVEACKQKYAGYTNLSLEHTNKFDSKYALKIYEMYKRYENMPSHPDCKNCIVIEKDFDYLNTIFCTSYRYPSEFLSNNGKKPINKGLDEIKKEMGIDIYCFYYKPKRVFVFSWLKKEKYLNLRIPFSKIHEFIEWYIRLRIEKIDNIGRYYKSLYKELISGTFNNLDINYRQFLRLQYNLTDMEIDRFYFNHQTNKYFWPEK